MQNQIEMTFQTNLNRLPSRQPGNRRGRARWWFQQMRQVVDGALDWKPANPARPEQTYFGLAGSR